MEFLVVSESKLKIMMSRDEMKKYNIDGDNTDYDNPKIRRSFWRILDVAKESCGFDVAGDKILIQFYPSKEGCEIFVTKLGLISASAERTISKSSKVAMLSTRRSIYKFSSFSSLISACRILYSRDYEGEPRAFFDESDNYYIIVNERAGKEYAADISPILEYGSEISSNLACYISEHLEEISFNVLRQL